MTNQGAEQPIRFVKQPFVWLEQRDIQDIRDRNVLRYLFLFFMGAVIASVAFWALQYWASPLPDASENTRNFFEWLNGLLQNAGTEFLGAFVTFYLIETLLRKRRAEDERRDRAALQARLDEDEERRTEELKALQREVAEKTRQQLTGFLRQQQADLDERERLRLINQTTSMVPGFAAEAVRLLKHHDARLTDEERDTGQQWYSQEVIEEAVKAGGDLSKVNLRGEVLQEADLQQANLAGALLQQANLAGARLYYANLEGAVLSDANLQTATLGRANLEGADLQIANLAGARLLEANLQGAILVYANLEGAWLINANLEGANLADAKLQGVDLSKANLEGALFLTVGQLRSAKTLAGATLPDGTALPDDDTWQDEFEHWVENTAQFKKMAVDSSVGTFIVPTRTEANAKRWDRL